jgi:hypothetical protein
LSTHAPAHAPATSASASSATAHLGESVRWNQEKAQAAQQASPTKKFIGSKHRRIYDRKPPMAQQADPIRVLSLRLLSNFGRSGGKN